jgi:hypothetical protein
MNCFKRCAKLKVDRKVEVDVVVLLGALNDRTVW